LCKGYGIKCGVIGDNPNNLVGGGGEGRGGGEGGAYLKNLVHI